MPIAMNLT